MAVTNGLEDFLESADAALDDAWRSVAARRRDTTGVLAELSFRMRPGSGTDGAGECA